MAVLFPTNVADIFTSLGGMSHTAVFRLFGIHSTKLAENLFWACIICSSTSFIDIFPRKKVPTVKYLPRRGSHAVIIFLASNTSWISCATVSARNCALFRDVSGAKPGIKKCNRGKGTMLTASFLRSAFSCPGNLRQVVTPDIVCETR